MRSAWRHALRWALVVLALAAVFAAYLELELAVDLAARVWACF